MEPFPLDAGTIVRTRSPKGEARVRDVVYVRGDQRAASVLLNQEFEVTEIVWAEKPVTKGKPEGDAYWTVAPRK